LSDTDCFVRQQIEVFCATAKDIKKSNLNCKISNPLLHVGQIGVRCIHCALQFDNDNKNDDGSTNFNITGDGVGIDDPSCTSRDNTNSFAVAYPRSIQGIYQSVRDIQRLHLNTCKNLPKEVKLRLSSLNGCASLSSFLRKYYVSSATAFGLKNTRRGIQPTGKPIPLGSQSPYALPERSPQLSELVDKSEKNSEITLQLEDRKRKSKLLSDREAIKRSYSG